MKFEFESQQPKVDSKAPELDFEDHAERAKICTEYGVMDTADLVKHEDGKYYYKGQSVRDYALMQQNHAPDISSIFEKKNAA